jgi:acyl-CoA thioester hydrolase
MRTELPAEAHFTFESEVHIDELDLYHMLHNSRYAVHVERADAAWYQHMTGKPFGPENDPDQFIFIREYRIEYLIPMMATGTMLVDLWSTKLGRTSSTYGFACWSADRSLLHASGHRTLVKYDQETRQPSPWTDEFREIIGRLPQLQTV